MEGKFNELETECKKENNREFYTYINEFKNSFK
jgi:hypothetical protein